MEEAPRGVKEAKAGYMASLMPVSSMRLVGNIVIVGLADLQHPDLLLH